MSSEHKSWNFRDHWHKGDDYGCYFRHAYTTKRTKNCNYNLNSFNISKKSRKEMYNDIDHHEVAVKNEFLTDPYEASKIKEAIDRKAAEKPKKRDEEWKLKFKNRIYSSFLLLELDKKAWHIGHTIEEIVTPWWDAKDITPQKPPAENFLPRKNGGWHCEFPYKHEHHHMISVGAFKKYVIYAEAEGKASPFKRALIVLRSNWNINRESNTIMLPCEEPIADVVQLPAHCPWNTASHNNYSRALETDLEQVVAKIDKAIETERHEELEKVSIILSETEEMLLEKIESMKGPLD